MASYSINSPSVISEVLDGETVVLNFDTGCYYSLNEAATIIWQALEAGEGIESAAARLEPGDGIDGIGVANAFVCRLLDEGLVHREDAGEPPRDAAADIDEASFESALPQFEKFDDLESLLLLDPIHDVSNEGWPRPPGKTA